MTREEFTKVITEGRETKGFERGTGSDVYISGVLFHPENIVEIKDDLIAIDKRNTQFRSIDFTDKDQIRYHFTVVTDLDSGESYLTGLSTFSADKTFKMFNSNGEAYFQQKARA